MLSLFCSSLLVLFWLLQYFLLFHIPYSDHILMSYLFPDFLSPLFCFHSPLFYCFCPTLQVLICGCSHALCSLTLHLLLLNPVLPLLPQTWACPQSLNLFLPDTPCSLEAPVFKPMCSSIQTNLIILFICVICIPLALSEYSAFFCVISLETSLLWLLSNLCQTPIWLWSLTTILKL